MSGAARREAGAPPVGVAAAERGGADEALGGDGSDLDEMSVSVLGDEDLAEDEEELAEEEGEEEEEDELFGAITSTPKDGQLALSPGTVEGTGVAPLGTPAGSADESGLGAVGVLPLSPAAEDVFEALDLPCSPGSGRESLFATAFANPEAVQNDREEEQTTSNVSAYAGERGQSGEESWSEGEEDAQYDEEDEERVLAHLRQVLLLRGCILRSQAPPPPLLSTFDIEGFAKIIRSAPPRSIVVLCGAGISVSAGIPDFRSPGTGLYDNLQKYDLPSPQAIFELSYFRERPDAFYMLAREMWPDNFRPTPTHHFIALLHDKGLLRRCFSQNIDSLEAAAGLPHHMTVAAHGNFDSCTCIETGQRVPVDEVKRAVVVGKEGPGGWLELREKYGGLVKPNIVFFGEQLPARFFEAAEDDLPEAEAMIVMGTSLKVEPFASLVGRVSRQCPRLLVNRELVGEGDPMLKTLGLLDPRYILHGDDANYRDAFFQGDCDNGVRRLASLLGWQDELEQRIFKHAQVS